MRNWLGKASNPLEGRYRPFLLIALAAVIPVLLFGSWAAYLSAEDKRADARATASRIATLVGQRAATELSTNLQVAEALAASSSLDNANFAAFHEEARRLKEAHPLWRAIALADPVGNRVADPLNDPQGPTGDRTSFERVIETGRPTVGGIGPDKAGSGLQVVSLTVPVLRQGELRYVLSVTLIPDAIEAILRNAGTPPGWMGTIVDAHGNVVAHTLVSGERQGLPASEALRAAIQRAPEGLYRASTPDGAEFDTYYRALAGTEGWTSHSGVPTELLDRPIRRSVTLMAGGGVATLMLGGALAAFTAGEVVRHRRAEAAMSALALQTAEAHARVAVEAAQLGTWRLDIAQRTLQGSERFRGLLDLPPAPTEEPCWSTTAFLQTVHPSDREMVTRAVTRCEVDGVPVDVEFRAVRRDGGTRWVRASGGRVPDIGEERSTIVNGVLADIEPRKRAEAERRDLLRRLVDAQESERRRIARELHDEVGQTVTALSLGFKSLEGNLEREGVTAVIVDRIKWLKDVTARVGREIHQAAWDLRPTALDDLGLDRAVSALAASWGERHGVEIETQTIGGAGGRLPPEVETTAYRVVQEALTNALKHALARNISIVLERKGGQLRVIVEDDGIGFDPDAVAHDGRGEDGHARPHLGLSGIRERLDLVGGTLNVESSPGAGATLFARIPLPPPDKESSA